jgi:hypothetical protein
VHRPRGLAACGLRMMRPDRGIDTRRIWGPLVLTLVKAGSTLSVHSPLVLTQAALWWRQVLVLDEADKLFELGKVGPEAEKSFLGQIDEIIAACTHAKVTATVASLPVVPLQGDGE